MKVYLHKTNVILNNSVNFLNINQPITLFFKEAKIELNRLTHLHYTADNNRYHVDKLTDINPAVHVGAYLKILIIVSCVCYTLFSFA